MKHKCDGCRYKGQHQEMMFRSMGVCQRTNNLVEAVLNYEAEKCPYKKTNADRIRSMSDEELAAALHQMLDGDVYCTNKPECGEMLNTEDGIPDEWCAQCLLNWLRKPAEVENNG
jgi:hypothetical protein